MAVPSSALRKFHLKKIKSTVCNANVYNNVQDMSSLVLTVKYVTSNNLIRFEFCRNLTTYARLLDKARISP